MRIIVFGASGSIGQQLTTQALEQGHDVVAFCRNIQNIENSDHPRLKIIKGDVLNLADVESAVIGQEVVCITLGSGKSRKSTVRSIGTKNIIATMKSKGVERLICQTTLGAGSSRGNLNFFWKYIMFGWFLKKIFIDHELQEKFVMESELKWTIVRPGAFTNGTKTGIYRHGFAPEDRSVKLSISRADVAHFILKHIGSDVYLRKAVGLSY